MDSVFVNKITTEEIKNLPSCHFEGKITIIDTPELAEEIIEELSNEKILGFDTETRPSFKKGKLHKVALLQLSTTNHAFLIRTNIIGLPDGIKKILSNPNIVKVGVAIRDDIRILQHLNNFIANQFIDLQNYVKSFGIEDNGLKKIAGIVLGIKISKNERLSNWENEILTEKQQIYAATDAWVCCEIYTKLVNLQS